MSKSALNISLQRTLQSGSKYNALFTNSSCKSTYLGKGDTYFGIKEIKEWVLDNLHQVNKSQAQKLFGKPSLANKCQLIHSFLYSHFQYNADGAKQHLFSPACAWKRRKQGIDCKSFTIIASAILTQLGVKHYLRKIKQPYFNPTEYTHIYVVVPTDQVTGELNNSYHVIDGTINTNVEPIFLPPPHDVFMDNKLKYYGMQGTAPTAPTTTNNAATVYKLLQMAQAEISTLQLFSQTVAYYANQPLDIYSVPTGIKINSSFVPVSEPTINRLTQILQSGLNGDASATSDDSSGDSGSWLSNVDFGSIFSSIGGIFSGIDCWGGSAFSESEEKQAERAINTYFSGILTGINQAVAVNDINTITEQITLFKAHATMAGIAYRRKLADGWNSCTEARFKKMIALVDYFASTVSSALDAWIAQYYTVSSNGITTILHRYKEFEVEYGFLFCGRKEFTHDQPTNSYTLKAGSFNINAFEYNEALNPDTNGGTLNTSQFLDSLTTVISTVTSSSTDTSTGTTAGTTSPTVTINTNGTQTVQKAGVSGIVKWGLGLTFLGLAANEVKKRMDAKKKTTPPKK